MFEIVFICSYIDLSDHQVHWDHQKAHVAMGMLHEGKLACNMVQGDLHFFVVCYWGSA